MKLPSISSMQMSTNSEQTTRSTIVKKRKTKSKLLKNEDDYKSLKKKWNKLKYGVWGDLEDSKLREAVILHGFNWTLVQQYLWSCSEYYCYRAYDCEKRWRDIVSKIHKKGPWTSEEDRVVRNLVSLNGAQKWSTLAEYVPGRTGKQCRERWVNHLAPDVNKAEWTIEEEQILRDEHEKLGNRWCKIALSLPGRSENAVKNRWNSFAARSSRKERVKTTTNRGKRNRNSYSSNNKPKRKTLIKNTTITTKRNKNQLQLESKTSHLERLNSHLESLNNHLENNRFENTPILETIQKLENKKQLESNQQLEKKLVLTYSSLFKDSTKSYSSHPSQSFQSFQTSLPSYHHNFRHSNLHSHRQHLPFNANSQCNKETSSSSSLKQDNSNSKQSIKIKLSVKNRVSPLSLEPSLNNLMKTDSSNEINKEISKKESNKQEFSKVDSYELKTESYEQSDFDSVLGTPDISPMAFSFSPVNLLSPMTSPAGLNGFQLSSLAYLWPNSPANENFNRHSLARITNSYTNSNEEDGGVIEGRQNNWFTEMFSV